MTKIIHLSDMHFGTEDLVNVDALREAVNQLEADSIVITGDFTQRARTNQFEAAQKLIKSLNHKNILCVPGNHDIPLHNLFMRFLSPFTKYKCYIAQNFNPTYIDDTTAIIGMNSVTPFTVMDGFVKSSELNIIKNFFKKEKNKAVKAVCLHHNMIQPELHKVLINLEEVLQCLAECGVQLILSGHLHDAFIEKIERPFINYNMYVITAATALSRRVRTQPQSFNVMTIMSERFVIDVHALTNGQYIKGEEKVFTL